MPSNLQSSVLDSIKIKKKLLNKKYRSIIDDIISEIFLKIKTGKKVFICGNGGSAADAQHLSAEFVIRLNPKKNREAYPLISLCADATNITACSNDFGFSNIFKRNLEVLGQNGDLLIVLSTSGNSVNIIKAIKQAKKMNIKTIGFLGLTGGKCSTLTDIELLIPSQNVARIQESHMFLGHHILNEVEKKLIS